MKTINISDEMYDSLVALSMELNSQSHRATRMPYFFQVQTTEVVASPDGIGTQAWHYDSSLIETEEEIKDAIFEWKGWDVDNQNDFDKLHSFEIEEMLEAAGYNKVWYDHKTTLQNAFFSETACKQHIEDNKHNYNKPIDYLSAAQRNPEMELVMKFLCEFTGGKLHT